MNKLLSSGFSRLKRDKIFWVCVTVLFLYSVISMLNGCRQALSESMQPYNYTLDNYYFRYSISIGLFYSLFTSMYLGTDYRDGTIRNKIITGHTRRSIYLSNLLISVTAAVFMLSVCLAGGLVGIPILGTWKMGSGALWYILVSILFTVCFCSIFTFVGMLTPYRSTAQVLSILLFFTLLLASIMLSEALQQPETVSDIIMTTDGMQMTDPMPNPAYVSGLKRDIYQFLTVFLPTGQSVRMFDMNISDPLLMALYSLLITLTLTASGIFLFQRKDLN